MEFSSLHRPTVHPMAPHSPQEGQGRGLEVYDWEATASLLSSGEVIKCLRWSNQTVNLKLPTFSEKVMEGFLGHLGEYSTTFCKP